MCYINGTKPPGSTVAEIGCTDQSPPLASRKVELPYSLYFSKERSKWGEGGVAFIDNRNRSEEITIGKMYLITEQQFVEIVAQENKMRSLEIDLQQVKEAGSGKVGAGWYSKILYVGEEDHYPIFTFTNPEPENVTYHKPNVYYISTIAKGLINLGYSKEAILAYFLPKRGVSNHFTKESLFSYLFK
jgi:hypothetical protein